MPKSHRDVYDSMPDLSDALCDAAKLSSIREIAAFLAPYYDRLVEAYEACLVPAEEALGSGDYRSGSEVYGYSQIESVQATLRYISDRWNCAFRVRWLIDLINPEYTLYSGVFNNKETEDA